MSNISEAYTLAAHIHDSFFLSNETLVASEATKAGVRVNPDSQPHHTPRLSIFGELVGRRAYQSLSLSKDGVYYFKTVFIDPGGESFSRITPNSPIEKLEELASSLFISALVDIANSRQ